MAGLLWSAAAAAHTPPAGCADRTRILQQLADKYQEAVIWRGVTNRGGMLELAESPDGVTWTWLLSNATGMTCVVRFGTGGRSVPREEPGQGT